MSTIGIIANPASGKDIRRLVSYATVVDNNEKVNIVKRIVLAAQAWGIGKIYVMPDTYQIGYWVLEDLKLEGVLTTDLEVIPMKIEGKGLDSTRAAQWMEQQGVGCIVVLGGDGTSRAVAKGVTYTPILPLSTGTNNVYPQMLEGTVAGMAAAAVALGYGSWDHQRDKRIELYCGDELRDIALVDLVISNQERIGAKALWKPGELSQIIVTQCHPASIGFSAILGCSEIVTPEDPYGLLSDLTKEDRRQRVSFAAGVIGEMTLGEPVMLPLDTDYPFIPEERGVFALDGERELTFSPGEVWTIRITRKGPLRVNVKATLELAQRKGFYRCL